MSLDFEIILEEKVENDSTKLISEIADVILSSFHKYPINIEYKGVKYFDNFNITHNLGKMAKEAGIYKVLWHPNENGYFTAGSIVDILQNGYDDLLERPEYYKQFNSSNGWGMYRNMVPFVKSVLDACKKYPNASIETST